jgi:hypothetical protein
VDAIESGNKQGCGCGTHIDPLFKFHSGKAKSCAIVHMIQYPVLKSGEWGLYVIVMSKGHHLAGYESRPNDGSILDTNTCVNQAILRNAERLSNVQTTALFNRTDGIHDPSFTADLLQDLGGFVSVNRRL